MDRQAFAKLAKQEEGLTSALSENWKIEITGHAGEHIATVVKPGGVEVLIAMVEDSQVAVPTPASPSRPPDERRMVSADDLIAYIQ
jgi:hypothetical protein